jgi:hypothetical protein
VFEKVYTVDTVEEVEEEETYIKELIREYMRNMRKLEIQRAKFGDHTPSHILTGIEDLKRELQLCYKKGDMLRKILHYHHLIRMYEADYNKATKTVEKYKEFYGDAVYSRRDFVKALDFEGKKLDMVSQATIELRKLKLQYREL